MALPTDAPSPVHCTHQLDIVKQFCSYANELLIAVSQGKDTHRSGNIAESGSPFETAFRKLFSDFLPASVAVWPGYFMDQDLNVSNQQDILFCNSRTALQLPPHRGMDQRYLLLSSVHIFGQLKNSATPTLLLNALTQNALAIAQARQLRANLTYQQILPREMSVLVFGEGGSAQMVQDALDKLAALPKSKPTHRPTYILLIERGVIFVPTHSVMFDMAPGFSNYVNSNILQPWIPKGPTSEAAGRALLWFFFAVAHKLDEDGLTNASLSPIIRRIELDVELQSAHDNDQAR